MQFTCMAKVVTHTYTFVWGYDSDGISPITVQRNCTNFGVNIAPESGSVPLNLGLCSYSRFGEVKLL